MLLRIALSWACLMATSAQAIVGGTPISVTEAPALEPLLKLTFNLAPCTGTYLGDGRILTAGHCVDNASAGQNRPTVCAESVHGKRLGCAFGFDYVLHQPTKDWKELDLAILELKPGRLVSALKPLRAGRLSLDALPAPPEARPELWIAGQGCNRYWTGLFESRGTGTLRRGRVRYIRASDLPALHHLLWAPSGSDAGACEGDSGGPLYSWDPSGTLLVHGVAQSIVKPTAGSKEDPRPVMSRYTRLDAEAARRWLESLQ
ncbi:MAG: trypsin-like serine protease [Bdellovibrionales bacterium]|nr:trypsin-like serine protease [Bdellovibrionales bacterium]